MTFFFLKIFDCSESSLPVWAFSSCDKRDLLFLAVLGLLVVVASPVSDRTGSRRCWLRACGSQTWLLLSVWDPPRSGMEPVSPALQEDSYPLRHLGSPGFLSNAAYKLFYDYCVSCNVFVFDSCMLHITIKKWLSGCGWTWVSFAGLEAGGINLNPRKFPSLQAWLLGNLPSILSRAV